MDVYLYAEGGVLPAQYDCDLKTDGVLADGPCRHAKGPIEMETVLPGAGVTMRRAITLHRYLTGSDVRFPVVFRTAAFVADKVKPVRGVSDAGFFMPGKADRVSLRDSGGR